MPESLLTCSRRPASSLYQYKSPILNFMQSCQSPSGLAVKVLVCHAVQAHSRADYLFQSSFPGKNKFRKFLTRHYSMHMRMG